ncbi:MAG: M23 family metallopeptidase [Rhodocyclaceae bacterium]
MRTAIVIVAALGCVLILAAFALGLLAGRMSQRPAPVAIAATPQHDPLRDRFSMERLGELSGRLIRLETLAQGLGKKMGTLDSIEKKLDGVRSGALRTEIAPGDIRARRAEGGPQLPARRCAQPAGVAGDVLRADDGMTCLQEMLALVEQAAKKRTVALMAVPARTPVEGVDTGSPYGNRVDPINGRVSFHSGLDFPAAPGTPIRAAGGGTVLFAGYRNEMGNMVEIDHGNGLVTRYAHSSRLYVKTGDLVAPSQVIAAVGSTGRSTGPHLHFEILHQGRFVNPAVYLALASDMDGL